MTARAQTIGHAIEWDNGLEAWIFSDTREIAYTPDMAGSGQFRRCVKCGLGPTPEGHDGCLGTLPESVVMNACCGHGDDDQAYIQYWGGECVRGHKAVNEIDLLKIVRKGIES